MLPNHHAGTYELYKADTDVIANWLANTARQCGYASDQTNAQASEPPKQEQGPRLKGKARKLAKDAAAKAQETNEASTPVRIVAVRDFVTLAGQISTYKKQPPVKVPSEIARSLNRAITLRKDHALWFQASQTADDGHNFFIGILEQVKERLKPLFSSQPVEVRNVTESLRELKVQPSDRAHIGNPFKYLDLEEPSEAFLNAPPASTTSGSTPRRTGQYRAERLQTTAEQDFAAHCLLNDVKNIREFISELWVRYRARKIELHVASMTTDVAIEIIRRKQEDYNMAFPHHANYDALAQRFYEAQCSHRGEDPAKREMFGDTFNMAMYDVADEILLPAYTLVEVMRNMHSPESQPMFDEQAFERHDASTPWSKKTPRQKFQEDKLVVLMSFVGLLALARSPCNAFDELVREVRKLRFGLDKSVPLSLVFAVQIFLDIQHVLGEELYRPFHELQKEGHRLDLTIERTLKLHKERPMPDRDPQADQSRNDHLLRLQEEIRRCASGEVFEAILLYDGIDNGRDALNLLKQYPMLCGIWIFTTRLLAQDHGINYANASGSITYCAHLYNAARQEKMLESPWQGMEATIARHKPDGIFIGELPTKPEDYLKRIFLCMGISATNWARDRRSASALRARLRQGPRTLSGKYPLSKTFDRRYLEKGVGVSNGPSPAETFTSSTKIAMDCTDFLEDLATRLQDEAAALKFDYFAFHRTCYSMIDDMQEKLGKDLMNKFGPVCIPSHCQFNVLVGYILTDVADTDFFARATRSRANLKSEYLSKAAAIMYTVLLPVQA